ncbi:TPA: glycerophosphodiester phosphodiesterase, partial [Streptococcus pneumoniae]
TIEELDFVLSFEGINIVAVELVFQDLENPIISKKVIDDLHEKGLLIWVNALTLSDSIILSAKIDDDTAIAHDGESWGKLVSIGFDIIQTDWPLLLYQYLVEKNKKIKK